MAHQRFNQAHFLGDIGPTSVTLTVNTVANFAVDDTVTQAVSGATGTITEIDATTPALTIEPDQGSVAFTYGGVNNITNGTGGTCVASSLDDVEIAYELPGSIRASATIIDLWAASGVSYYKLKLNDGISPEQTGIYAPGSKKLLPGARLTMPSDFELKRITAVPYDGSDNVIQAGLMGYICLMGASSHYTFSLVV